MKKEKNEAVNKSDLVSLIMTDLPELTDGRFHVCWATDGLGNHLELQLEDHTSSEKIKKFMNKHYPTRRIIIMNVPSDFLKEIS